MDMVKHMKGSNIQSSQKELVQKLSVEKNRSRKFMHKSYYTHTNKRHKEWE